MNAPSNELRVGVIGLGNRSNLADIVHRAGSGARITHVCDAHPAKQAAAVKRFGSDVRFTTDARALTDDASLDAVMVLSPDWLHAEHAIAAMEAGKAVFLEKPMAITIVDCDRILATAKRAGVKLYVGHNMRHMDFILKMKSLIDAGAIGQVQTAWERHFINYGGDAYYYDWHADRRYATGLLLQKAAHDLDVMHWLCRGYTARVQAMGKLSVYNRVTDRAEKAGDFAARFNATHWPPLKASGLNPVIDVEDLSLLNAELDNGVMIAYQQCQYTPDELRNYTFIGDAGRIESVKDEQDRWVIRLWNHRHERSRPQGDEQFVLEPLTGGHGGADPVMITQFLNYLRGTTDPSCTPIDARMAVAAGCQATESIRHGNATLAVPPIDPQAIH
jgi:predicted dehydrogenase